MLEKMAAHIERLATQAIPPEHLASFLALDMRAKLVGLATLAHTAGDPAMRTTCLALLNALPSYYLGRA